MQRAERDPLAGDGYRARFHAAIIHDCAVLGTGSFRSVRLCAAEESLPQHRSVPSERLAFSWDGVAVGNWRFRRSLRAVPGVRLTLSETRHGPAQDGADCGSGSAPSAVDDLPPVLARARAAFDRLRLRPEEPSLVEELQS